ncbi:MAG TPA: amino acid transporter, partial [Actinomycetota bacterium]|nr:amino acid transporter [Actinomycetota bacterium]
CDHLDRLGPPGGFLSPEIALLYKTPDFVVTRNAADFAAVLPRLGVERALWLARVLRLAHPHHPWVDRLEALA